MALARFGCLASRDSRAWWPFLSSPRFDFFFRSTLVFLGHDESLWSGLVWTGLDCLALHFSGWSLKLQSHSISCGRIETCFPARCCECVLCFGVGSRFQLCAQVCLRPLLAFAGASFGAVWALLCFALDLARDSSSVPRFASNLGTKVSSEPHFRQCGLCFGVTS